MPQIPYSSVSTAQPQGGGESVSVSTPGAAFGENVGASLRELGSSVGQVGNELFSRAIALQDLRNETDARAAQSEYAEKASLAHAQYGALEGKAAVDGLQPYMASQRQLREGIRGQLTTPVAQRMFDADTLPFMQRNVFSAAGHAADQNKRWVVGTAQAGIDLEAKTFVDPANPKEFDAKIDRINKLVSTVSAANNWEPSGAQEQDYKLKITSNLRMGQITQTANTNPQQALQMLDQYKGEMTEPDYNHTLDAARARNRAVGTAVLANSVYSPDKTYQQMLDEGNKQTEKLAHGDPLFGQDFERALRGKAQADRYATTQDNNRSVNTIYDGIQSGVTNFQQLLAKPGMQEAFDALPPKQQAQVPGWINSYNAKRDKTVDEETFTRLRGLASNDVESFLNSTQDAASIPGLSQSHIRQVMKLRQDLIQNPRDDPRVLRAMQWMRGAHGSELDALGIMSRTTNNQDAYDHYTGSLEGAIEAWTTEQKHPPSYKQVVDEIGPQLIRSVVTPGAIFGGYWTNKTPFYEALDTQVQAAKDEATKRGMEPPTDNEIRRAYMSQLFQKLYGGASAGPSPPQSK